jgi:DNA adenine methylase
MSVRKKAPEALVQPFLKWAGGKRQLLPEIRKLIPKKIRRYYEPFIGGGAVLFGIQPKQATVNDFNSELINCYQVIKDQPEELLEVIGQHQNTSEHFYHIRELDRTDKFKNMSPVQKAARILYLNKTCFNGLFRVNSQGQFNVPFGNYKDPVFADPAVIRAVSRYLNNAEILFSVGDFADAVASTQQNDFVYFDPPYDPVSDTASFTGYSMNGFSKDEQQRLKKVCDSLTQQGVQLLLSNSDTPFIQELYGQGNYFIKVVEARRNINAVGAGRGRVNELLISNYDMEVLR